MSTAYAIYDHDAFYRAVITGLGFDVTDWRMEYFRKWAAFENTQAGYNPLATTRVSDTVPVDSNWNDNDGVPVKNYSSFGDGVQATLETLRLPFYTLVIESLRQQAYVSGSGEQLRKWGTMGFAEYVDTAKSYQPTRVSGPPVPFDVSLGYLALWGTYYTADRPHLGIDYGAPVGTPFRNPYLNPAKVEAIHLVDANNRPLDGWGDGTLGNLLVIDIQGTRFYGGFAHLSRVDVEVGQVLQPGQVLGLTGASGYVDGAHLHWQHTVDAGFSRAAETEDPMSGLTIQTQEPIEVPPASDPAYEAVTRLNYAITLRNKITRIAADPDFSRVEQAAAALRGAGFEV